MLYGFSDHILEQGFFWGGGGGGGGGGDFHQNPSMRCSYVLLTYTSMKTYHPLEEGRSYTANAYWVTVPRWQMKYMIWNTYTQMQN